MTRGRRRTWAGAVLAAWCTWSAAQPQGVVPRLPQDEPVEPRPATRALPIVLDVDRTAEQMPPEARDVRFRLVSLDLVGNTAMPSARFEHLWADRIGREIPLSDLFTIAAAITATYRGAGYVLSRAIVPRQEIMQVDGRVHLRVVEGTLSRITVPADVAGAGRIERMLAPILAERPATMATLERQLLLVNDLPGTRTVASLRAAAEDSAAEMALAVDRERNAFSAALHNRTSYAIGPMRLELSGERRGLVGDFDRHVLRYAGSGNQRLRLLAYSGDAPVGDNGGQVAWSASASESNPKSGEAFNLDTDSRSASLGGSYPVWRSRARNLTLRGAFTAYNGSSDIVDGLSLSKDRIRAVRAGFSADSTDPWGGVNLVDGEFSKGLGAFGASEAGDPALSRAGADPQFKKATLYVARLQSLGGEWSLLAAVSGQYTGEMLVSSEQFGLGGDVFLRAYDPSELIGDRGLAGKLEVRFNHALGLLKATAYGFWDTGRVDLLAGDGSRTSQSALSSGLGVRLTAPKGVRGFVEVAKPRHLPTDRYGDLRSRWFAGIGIDL